MLFNCFSFSLGGLHANGGPKIARAHDCPGALTKPPHLARVLRFAQEQTNRKILGGGGPWSHLLPGTVHCEVKSLVCLPAYVLPFPIPLPLLLSRYKTRCCFAMVPSVHIPPTPARSSFPQVVSGLNLPSDLVSLSPPTS